MLQASEGLTMPQHSRGNVTASQRLGIIHDSDCFVKKDAGMVFEPWHLSQQCRNFPHISLGSLGGLASVLLILQWSQQRHIFPVYSKKIFVYWQSPLMADATEMEKMQSMSSFQSLTLLDKMIFCFSCWLTSGGEYVRASQALCREAWRLGLWTECVMSSWGRELESQNLSAGGSLKILCGRQPLKYLPGFLSSWYSCPYVLPFLGCGLDLVSHFKGVEFSKNDGMSQRHGLSSCLPSCLCSCCEMLYGETHISPMWGRPPANSQWGTEAFMPTDMLIPGFRGTEHQQPPLEWSRKQILHWTSGWLQPQLAPW